MRRAVAYLSDCERHKISRKRLGIPDVTYATLPLFHNPPCCKWFLATYIRDVWSRLPALKSRITSVYGTILKIDSTKKITLKLQVYFILNFLYTFLTNYFYRAKLQDLRHGVPMWGMSEER
jgi:hypothetical protein